mmetsp:Transcript_34944/g.79940  ORF Transcript_34944/g.79940 Transcript_34944/m.79940 type:complete len:478 (-) Transcript_34944:285-1718(-)
MLSAKQWAGLSLAESGLRSKVGELQGGLALLASEAPRDLWLLLVIKFLESFASFGTSIVLILFLTADLGFSDASAALVFGVHGAAGAVLSYLGGVIVDYAGVKWTLTMGAVLLAAGRAVLAFSTASGQHTAILTSLFVLLPMGSALCIPVLALGVRRISSGASRGFAFQLFYVVMNVACLAACVFIHAIRTDVAEALVDPTALAYEDSIHRGVLFAAFVASVVTLALVLAVGVIDVAEPTSSSGPADVLKELAGDSGFWRFGGLTLLFSGVRMAFRHVDTTFPKLYEHMMGAQAPFECILALNPALLLVLLPFVSHYTAQHQVPMKRCLLYGAFLSGASPFVLALSSRWQAACCWIIMLTLGEALWSPKLYEYSVSIAPLGREGTYLAIASGPVFFAKIAAAALSGVLVQDLCSSPLVGETFKPLVAALPQCSSVWFCIGLTTIACPLAMWFLQGSLFEQDKQETTYGATEDAEATG